MNYYKILNKEEKHRKMQYKTGLNTNIEKFNPKGDCTGGGIYFARENIFRYFSYGPYIRKVTLPKDEPVYQNPGGGKWKAHRVILGKRRKINSRIVKSLIKEGATISNDLLDWAVCNNFPSTITYISSNFSKGDLNDALGLAVDDNCVKSAKALIPYITKKYCKVIADENDMDSPDTGWSKGMVKLFKPYIKKKR